MVNEERIRRVADGIRSMRNSGTSYKHAYDAFFDGLKYIGDPKKPFIFQSPMAVRPNLYYIKDGELYVCMGAGICTDATFSDFMVPWAE